MGNLAALPQSQRDGDRYALNSDHFVWLVSNLCKGHGIQIEPSFLLRSFRPPHDREQLIDAIHACGLRAGLLRVGGEDLKYSLLPVIAFPRPIVSSDKATEIAPPSLVVIVTNDRFLYVEAGSNAPRFRMKRNFLEFFEPTVILGSRPADHEVTQSR